MKRTFLFSLILSAFFLILAFNYSYADQYYVSNAGDDLNSGTSPDSPWKTLEKVNSKDFEPGDTIHFNKGDLWRGQLIPSSGDESGFVTYTSYGEGRKPQILGSVSMNNVNNWVQQEKNIWMVYEAEINKPFKFPEDVGNIIFDGDICGVKVFNESELRKQNDFWYDESNKILKIYSLKNPAEIYDEIECALSQHIINQNDKSYVIYDGLEIKYGGAHGIGGDSTHHIKVLNCDVNYIGGGKFIFNGEIDRYGNGIEFWSDAHDILVEGCNIWEIYDTALTNQGARSGFDQYNIVYRNNKIWNAQWSFELWYQNENAALRDIYFENNVCRNAGLGWGSNQRTDQVGGRHLSFFSSLAKASDIYISNNTFDNATEGIFFLSDNWNDSENLILENNTYVQQKDKFFSYVDGELYFSYEFDKYKSETGKDSDSEMQYRSSDVVVAMK